MREGGREGEGGKKGYGVRYAEGEGREGGGVGGTGV